MKKLRKILLAVAAALSVCLPAMAQADPGEPAITFKTNIYKTYGETNSFHILLGSTEKSEYYDVDMGFGLNEFEVGYATVGSDGAWVGSTLVCRVSEAGEVKIYGDPEKIDVFIADGCYISEIDLSRCVNLDVLSLEHNELTGLDLTPNTRLRAIYLNDNPGRAETPIKIGLPKPDLQILEATIIDHFDPDFKPEYPNLAALDLYHTTGVSKLDLAGCPNLLSLVVEFTAIDKLDLTPVPNMWHLNIAESRITDIDLSKTPNLTELLCSHTSPVINQDCKLRSIDLTHNPKLTYLSASGNLFESLDVSKNEKLRTLYARYNNLNALNIENNDSLAALDLTGNRFTFSTLPAERETFAEYYYKQQPVAMPRCIAKGKELDFADMLRADGPTYARVLRHTSEGVSDTIPESDYSWNGETGVLAINKCYSDSVSIEFANLALASYTMTTTPFMIKEAGEVDKPSRIVSLQVLNTDPINFKVGLACASAAMPAKILIDFGDGELSEFDVTSPAAESVVSGQPKSYNINIYVPEGDVLTALDVDDVKLISLDVLAATELQTLSAEGTGIYSVDLRSNRCLKSLNLSDNNLYTLDLSGFNGAYEKNVLTRIEASNNSISDFKIINTTGCLYLDLSGNNLSEFSLKDFDNMQHLNLSGNQLSEINLAYMANAKFIDISGNKLKAIEGLVEMPELDYFNISGNEFTLTSLPRLDMDGYVYAPQSAIEISPKAPSISLEAQYVEIDGAVTSYEWVYADGTAMKEGTDYTINHGNTAFITIDKGPVSCRISHPAFPEFAGENVLKTTEVQPMGAPVNVVATFKVTSLAEGATVGFTGKRVNDVYIDWTGDRQDFHCYPVTTQFSLHGDLPAEAVGKTATIYTYSDTPDITVCSIEGIGMEEFDGSKMTECFAFMLYDTGIDTDKIVFPNPAGLVELSLTGTTVETFDLTPFENLTALNFSEGVLTDIDLSKCPKLLYATLNSNDLSNITMNNPMLNSISLSDNCFEKIDLTGLPALSQLVIGNNELSSIDLSPVASTLTALVLSGNKFTFATLPRTADLPRLGNAFYYSGQAPVVVEVKDGVVDLSAQSKVDDTATEFAWYYGDIEIDYAEKTVVGEKLDSESENPEVTVENGISTFHVNYDEPVTCVMTNSKYPNLMLVTSPVLLNQSGVGTVDTDKASATVSVYSVSGMAVRLNVPSEEALSGIPAGIYIVTDANGKASKVFVR